VNASGIPCHFDKLAFLRTVLLLLPGRYFTLIERTRAFGALCLTVENSKVPHVGSGILIALKPDASTDINESTEVECCKSVFKNF
jgi:hypothetical protein